MKLFLFSMLLLISVTALAQTEKSLVVVEPSELPEDMTGIHLKSAGAQLIAGPMIATIGGVAAGLLAYYAPEPESAYLGAAFIIIGAGVTISGCVNLIKAGRSYELHHQK